MAVRYYALAKGAQKTAVVESATATLAVDGVEISVRFTGHSPDTAELNRLIEETRNRIFEDIWPPA